MSNIINFERSRNAAGGESPDELVKCLEGAMVKAKAGEFSSLAVVAVSADGMRVLMMIPPGRTQVTLLGALVAAQHDLFMSFDCHEAE